MTDRTDDPGAEPSDASSGRQSHSPGRSSDTSGRSNASSGSSDRFTATPGPSLDRRTLLRIGSVGAAATLAGCWGTDSDDGSRTDAGTDDGSEDGSGDGEGGADGEIPYAGEYDRVVDLVADAGADPHAEESIVPVLEEAAGDDTLLYFPEGRYLMDDLWALTEFEHLGVVGEDATIVPERGALGYLFVFGMPERSASDLLFEGLEFDFTAPETAPRPIQVQIDDAFVVRDVQVRGVGGTARFDVTSSDGSGVVHDLRLPDGGMEPNPVGILVGPANRGLVRFEECHVEGFPGNGLYASPSNGPIEVVGGLYANNGIANVRVSSPAVVRDLTVRCDEAPAGFRNMRGIRLRNGPSALVENCTVEMSAVTYSEGAVVVEPMMESATIRDVDIELSADEVPAINARSPQTEAGGTAIECEDVTVTGDAARGSAVRVVDRNDCVLERLDIEQSGSNRDGVHLVRSSESILRNCEIDVTGEPVVLEQSQIRTVDTRL